MPKDAAAEGHEIEAGIRVERGAPDAAELAAVIAILEAAHAEELAASDGVTRALKSTWSRNRAQLRHDVVPGAGQWRGSMRDGLN